MAENKTLTLGTQTQGVDLIIENKGHLQSASIKAPVYNQTTESVDLNNFSFGEAGSVLTSDGTNVYWGHGGGGSASVELVTWTIADIPG